VRDGIETIYLSGPMTGLPESNYPLFNVTAMRLRNIGYSVLNPAEQFGGDPTLPRQHYIRQDVVAVATKADAVAVLPNWETSRGARLEVEIARQVCIPVIDAETLEPIAEES
jgi:hypothetical protein